MTARDQKIAAIANSCHYAEQDASSFVDSSPHIKHPMLRQLYGSLLWDVFQFAHQTVEVPRVLDLGAGEGSVTLPFLQLGARVTAVDVSATQLERLRNRCSSFSGSLETCQGDVNDILENFFNDGESFNVVVTNSFLHHIPDYLSLIRQSVRLLPVNGQFFAFQDPLRYDSLTWFNRRFSRAAYLIWRLCGKKDLIGSFWRALRRSRGIYLETTEDNAEYHIVRNGVDQEAVLSLLQDAGFKCRFVEYFSTQSRLLQLIGTRIGAKNTFGVIAQRVSKFD